MTTTSGTRRALARAAAGKALDHAEVAVLLSARDSDLVRLVGIAGEIRDRADVSSHLAGLVTYSPKVFIPLTRLCRDRCRYCTFVTTPKALREAGEAPYLDPEEVLEVARRGADAGCLEALFTLGDRPEDRWPVARQWLSERGYASTLEYLRAMAVLVLEETGLLPHLNPGVMTWAEMNRLRPVAPSMGMMLETTSRRLFEQRSGAHFGSPDKDPEVRLRVLHDAGRLAIPFTTGLLLGIGESLQERADSLLQLRSISRRYGHLQEVIMQNFRAKPRTAMKARPDCDHQEYIAAVAAARILLGAAIRLQAPPNLSEDAELADLLAAGVNDWGGISPVTVDHVNPERPWPHLDRLAEVTSDAGLELRPRLTVHPSYVLSEQPWIDPRVRPHVEALVDPRTGLAVPGIRAQGRPWQEPEGTWGSRGRVDLHAEVDTSGRTQDRRSDYDRIYGDWAAVSDDAARAAHTGPAILRSDDLARGVRLIADSPARLLDPRHQAEALALLGCDGADLDEVCRLADLARASAVGDEVTYVINRNINFTNVCYVGCRFCAFAQRKTDPDAYSLSLEEVGERVREAVSLGATEICMQGGIDPDLPADGYFRLAKTVKAAAPDIHLHAFSPMEVMNGVAKTGLSLTEFLTELRDAGVDTIPGTAAEILDDDVRWVLTKGKLPTKNWVEVVTTAHQVGLRSSATMMYGHVDHPQHWLTHLRVIAEIQDRTGGFTEFVPLPFVHTNAPVYLAGVARAGATWRENRVVHAMSRLLLHGRIDNIQVSWVKLGPAGVRQLLESGANDLGGTLMEETISRMAGSQHGSQLQPDELVALAASVGRQPRQRTTTYGRVHSAPMEPASGGTGDLRSPSILG